jgi:hypothetical protein
MATAPTTHLQHISTGNTIETQKRENNSAFGRRRYETFTPTPDQQQKNMNNKQRRHPEKEREILLLVPGALLVLCLPCLLAHPIPQYLFSDLSACPRAWAPSAKQGRVKNRSLKGTPIWSLWGCEER